jgi:2-polyprenyl-3-methyl-5-hydroxy-6-metoxy-1,4-benzoquinol methylase
MDDFFATNRRNWDERVPIHLRDRTGTYQIDAFLAGLDTLYAIEAAEIGDVSGKRLLHLQCHFGLDTLSLARRGAHVTGIDFSGSAIETAHAFACRTGIAARFVEGNVYDAATLAPGPFDIVYSTWGTITWLPDMVRWARTIANVLAPGGLLYLADDHPAAQMLEEVDGALVATYPWRTPPDCPLSFEASTSYAGDQTQLANTKSYQWIHPLSDILSALLDAELSLEMLHEHECVPWKPFSMMFDAGDGLYRLPDGAPRIPLAMSLRARKS